MSGRVAIVGWAQTKHERRKIDTHVGEMVFSVTKAALSHAGIGIEEIDTVVSASDDVLDGRSISNVFLVEAMGAFLKEETKVEDDGAFAAMYAYYRLLSGHHQTALVVGHSKGSESSPQSYSGLIGDCFFMRPLGLEAITTSALQARAYMNRWGTTDEQVAKVAVKNRTNGLSNPHVHAAKSVTLQEVLSSPVIASPLKRLECSPVTDGAAALVLATEERARKITKRPVWIQGVGFFHDAFYPGHRDLATSRSAQLAARKAFAEADISNPRNQLDFAELFEPFAFHELLLYESLGLCAPGEGGKLCESGFTQPRGEFPVNRSGGALCANPLMATGLVRLLEASRQLSGEADVRAGRHGRALVHSTSGLCLQSNIVFVLGID